MSNTRATNLILAGISAILFVLCVLSLMNS